MTTYISFSAEINVNTTENLIAVLAQQANQGVDHVYLMLSTPGGAVVNGLNLYNVMKAMPFKITTHNVGNLDSIGNAIFLAGENVSPVLIQPLCFMGSDSTFRPGQGWNRRTFRKI